MITTIRDVCDKCETVDPTRDPNRPFRYVDISAVDNRSKRIVAAKDLLGKDAPSRARLRIAKGDVLVATTRPNLNAVALVPNELDNAVCSTGFCVLRPRPGIDPDFLFLSVQSTPFVAALTEYARGANYPAVSDKQVLAQPINLPDLSTQRKIAARLKSQMAAVEQARQRLDAQIRDAEQLRLRYFRDAFGEGNLARWPVRSLSDLADIVSGMTLGGAKPKEPTDRVPYLRVANVKDGWLMLDDVKEIDATEKDIERFQLKNGDVVLTEGGDPDKLGRGTVWREEIGQCLHQNHIFRVRFNPREVCPEFAAYQFGSHHGKAYFLTHAKQTTGIASINKGVLSRFPFHLPDLPTQSRLAARLNASFGLIRRLQSAHQAQLEALDRLPAALLREAFASIKNISM